MASHVTMVQRTPTYIVTSPEKDAFAQFLNDWLPSWLALRINRWKYIIFQTLFYQFCIGYPNAAKKLIKGEMFKQVKLFVYFQQFVYFYLFVYLTGEGGHAEGGV